MATVEKTSEGLWLEILRELLGIFFQGDCKRAERFTEEVPMIAREELQETRKSLPKGVFTRDGYAGKAGTEEGRSIILKRLHVKGFSHEEGGVSAVETKTARSSS